VYESQNGYTVDSIWYTVGRIAIRLINQQE